MARIGVPFRPLLLLTAVTEVIGRFGTAQREYRNFAHMTTNNGTKPRFCSTQPETIWRGKMFLKIHLF